MSKIVFHCLIYEGWGILLQGDSNLDISAQAKVSIPAYTKIYGCHRIFWCFCSRVCDNIAYYNAVLGISFKLQVNWDIATKQLKVNVGSIAISTISGPDVQDCHPSHIVEIFTHWHTRLNEDIEDRIKTFAANFQQSFSLPPTVKLTEGLYANYTVQNIIWMPGDSATIVANALIFGEIEGKNVTYEPDKQKAILPIAMTDFPKTDSRDPKSHLLQASRLSSIFLTGLVWYADKTGQLFYHNNATVLDSFLNVTLFISPPGIDIPLDDTLNVTINDGSFDAMCRKEGSADPRQIIKIIFENLQGSGALLYTNDSTPGVILQLVDLIFDHMTLQPVEPHLPLPASLEHGIVLNAINQSKPLVNTYLQNNPLIIPSSIKPYVAHPVIEVFAGEPKISVGYIQISSYCSCEKSVQKFVLCGQNSGICPASKKADTSNGQFRTPVNAYENDDSEASDFITLNSYDNGDCNLIESNVDLFNVKTSAGKCLNIDQFSGLKYRLDSRKGPLHWHCYDPGCKYCEIIIDNLSPNNCYGGANSSLSVGSVCQQDKLVTKNSLLIQTYSDNSENCTDDVINGNVTWLSFLEFWSFTSPGDNSTRITENTRNKSFNVSLYCSNSTSSDCNVTATNVKLGQCFHSHFKLIAAPERCPVPPPWMTILTVTIFIILLSGIISVDAIFFKFRGSKWIFATTKEALRKLWVNLKTGACQFIRQSSFKIDAFMRKSWEMIRTAVRDNLGIRKEFEIEDVFQIILCLSCFVLTMWQKHIWVHSDTVFSLFTGNITGKFSIADDLVETKDVNKYFRNYELTIAHSIEISGICLFIPLVIYMFFPKSSFNFRTFPRILVLVACLICSLGVPMLPLFVQPFGTLIHLGANNATGIENPKFHYYIQMALRESFTGLVSARFAGLVMNLFQGLNAGMFLAVIVHEMIYRPVRGESIIIYQMYNLISFGTVLQVFFSIHPVIVWTQYSSVSASFFLLNAFLWILPLMSWILKTILSSMFHSHFPASRFTSPTFLFFTASYVIATDRVVEIQEKYYNDDRMETFIITQILSTLLLTFSITYMLLAVGHHGESYYFVLGRECFKVRNRNADRNGFEVLENEANERDQNEDARQAEPNNEDEVLDNINLVVQHANEQIDEIQYANGQVMEDHDDDRGQNAENGPFVDFTFCGISCHCFSNVPILQFCLEMIAFVVNWLLETTEHGNPNRYGLKIEKRRLFLCIGCLAFSYATYDNVMYELRFNAREQIQQTLDSLGLNLTWPSNGTTFDNAFEVYNEANLRQTCVFTAACLLFWLAFLADFCSYLAHWQSEWKLRFLLCSRLFGIFGGLCIFASIAVLASPNYMAAISFDSFCPDDCGQQFKAAIETSSEFVIGLFIGVLFTLKLAPVLFTVAPALVRTSVLILIHPKFADQKFSQWDNNIVDLPALNAINRIRITLLKGVCVAGAISALPLTLLAVGILVQFEENEKMVITLIVLFWSAPFTLLITFLTLHATTGNSKFLSAAYFVYTVTYFTSLVCLICYCLQLYGKLSIITKQLKTFIFWCELISEVFLTNIALSDLLYISLF